MQPFNAALFLFNGIAAQFWFLGINLFMSQFDYKIFRITKIMISGFKSQYENTQTLFY